MDYGTTGSFNQIKRLAVTRDIGILNPNHNISPKNRYEYMRLLFKYHYIENRGNPISYQHLVLFSVLLP